MRLVALAVLFAIVLVAAAACGGESPPPAAPGSPERPLVATQRAVGGTAGGRSNEAAGSGEAARSAPGPSYESLLGAQSRHPRSRFTPCNLVTAKQARAIVGAPMEDPVEAKQGPTCIYRSKDGRSFVTVAVQPIDIDKLTPRLRLRRRVEVAGRTAYCGTYGQPMLYVPLSGERVLSVAGQCAIATEFARRAVREL